MRIEDSAGGAAPIVTGTGPGPISDAAARPPEEGAEADACEPPRSGAAAIAVVPIHSVRMVPTTNEARKYCMGPLIAGC